MGHMHSLVKVLKPKANILLNIHGQIRWSDSDNTYDRDKHMYLG